MVEKSTTWSENRPLKSAMSTDLKHPLISLVGGARGRLLDTVARVGRPFSIRQLADMSGIVHSQARDLLREFEGLGLVRSQRVGRSIAYEPVDGNVLLELLRRIAMLRDEIIDRLREEAAGAPRHLTVAVFGSVARGKATDGSDLDLLVIGGESPDAEAWTEAFLRRATEISGMPVNALKYSREEWDEAKDRQDLIAEEIMDGSILLVGRL